MKISFWSNASGKNCVTSNLACIAVLGALTYHYRAVIMENHYNYNNLEHIFLGIHNNMLLKEDEYYYNHLGMDAIIKKMHSKVSDQQLIEGCCMTFLNRSIYYLPQSHYINQDIFEYELNSIIEPLIEKLNIFSEVTFFDTNYSNALSTKTILDSSDLIVVNLAQDGRILEHFFENYKSILSKAVILLSCYNPKSIYNRRNIIRKHHLSEKKVAVIPYNVEFKDALSEGRTIEFLSRNYYCKRDDSNYYFMKECKKATSMVLQNMMERRTKV